MRRGKGGDSKPGTRTRCSGSSSEQEWRTASRSSLDQTARKSQGLQVSSGWIGVKAVARLPPKPRRSVGGGWLSKDESHWAYSDHAPLADRGNLIGRFLSATEAPERFEAARCTTRACEAGIRHPTPTTSAANHLYINDASNAAWTRACAKVCGATPSC